ncbi:MAG: tetratricopeptide repeat protein [Candidatus Eremiobacteraeota bacterium]|nr:tetratricopeptide repeat protein [Candidatus Eremiobacteraeota bacterium]
MSSKEFEMFVKQGDTLATQGKLDEAVDMYQRALQFEPQNSNVRRNIVNIFMKKGEFDIAVQEYLNWARACQERGALDDALTVYQEIIGLEGQAAKKSFLMGQRGGSGEQLKDLVNNIKGEIFYQMGMILQTKGHLDDSIQYLRACYELSPQDAKVHMALGQAYMKKGMDKEAVGEFQEVVRLAPADAAYAYEMLGEIYIRGGRTPQGTIVWFRNAGELYMKNNQLVDTIRAFERILNFEPRNKEVLQRLSEIYAQKGSVEKAVECIKKLAQIYTEEGLLDKVVGLYERLNDIDPDNVEVRKKLIDIYRQILKMDPGNLTARHKLIGLLLNDGNSEEAIPEFLSLASTYLEKGMLVEGLSVCQKMLDIDPNNLKANEILGEIYYRQGQHQVALDQYLHVVKILRERGDEEKANSLNKELVVKFPDQVDLYYQEAIKEKENGNFDSALKILENILRNTPGYKQALFAKADIHVKMDEWHVAYETYQKILELEPTNTDVRKILLEKCLEEGDLEQALDETKKISEMLFGKADYREVENIYRKILAFVPDNIELRERLCEVQAARGHIEKAINGYLVVFNIYLRMEMLEEAIRMCNRILDLSPENMIAHRSLGALYKRVNVREALVQYSKLAQLYLAKSLDIPATLILNEILEIEPENITFRQNLIDILVKQIRFEEATDHYKYLMVNYLKENEVEKAQEVVREIIALQPFNLELRQNLSQIFLEQNHLEEAQKLLEELVQLYLDKGEISKVIELNLKMAELVKAQSNMSLYWDYREKIASLFYRDNQVQNALSQYSEIIKELIRQGDFDREREIFTMVEEVYFKEGLADEGIKSFERMVSELFHEGVMEGALCLQEQIEKMYERKDDWGKALEILGFMAYQYEDLGNISQALRVKERIASIHLNAQSTQEVIEVYFGMIELHLKQRELAQALGLFQQIQEWKPESLDFIFRMAEALFSNGFLEEAKPLYEKIVEAEPGHYEGMTRLAIIHAKHGALELAVNFAKQVVSKGLMSRIVEEYKKAVQVGNDEAMAHINLGLFYEEMGFMEEAIMEYQKASKDHAHILEAHTLLGKAFKKEGFTRLAIKQFQRALDLDFSDEDLQEIRYNLGLTYQEMGTIEDALGMFQECYAIDIRYKDVSEKINELSQILSDSEGKVIPFSAYSED